MWTTMASPVGPLRIVASDVAVRALYFLDAGAPATDDEVAARYLARAKSRDVGERSDTDPLLRDAAGQLTAYFAGRLQDFDLPLDPVGTPFQQAVWGELRTVPYGETATYGELATRLGKTGHGARAVGLANGRNPIAIVVPCHRVVGAGGKLIGYGGGLQRKQRLLALEQTALF